ncbi:MAG: hypothetical protein WDA59_07140 [Methanofastidiosum sp.]
MFYVIERNYVGPNPDRYCDFDFIVISKVPTFKNMSKEDCIEGWCGTTSDVSITAHGQYETVEKALETIQQKFGEVREVENEEQNPDIVAIFKPGKFAPITKEFASDLAYDWGKELNKGATDKEIDNLITEMEEWAQGEGFTVSGHKKYIKEEIEELLKEN